MKPCAGASRERGKLTAAGSRTDRTAPCGVTCRASISGQVRLSAAGGHCAVDMLYLRGQDHVLALYSDEPPYMTALISMR